MERQAPLRHEFVEYIPDELFEGTIYISVAFATIAHKCCCGCGREVVTPLSPTDWKLTFDGETISLWPSIGNWSFPCQSHYWIVSSGVRWAEQWSPNEISAGRGRDTLAKLRFYECAKGAEVPATTRNLTTLSDDQPETSIFKRLTSWFWG